MFKPDTDAFVLLPEESQDRILHPASVVECDTKRMVARLSEPLALPINSTVFLHCEHNRRFMQQPAIVQAVLEADPDQVVAFSLFGEPISAENRMSYRVSVAASELHATLCGHDRCVLTDVSATGFGLTSKCNYAAGQTIDVTVTYDGCSYTGQARVQSVRVRGDGEIRYGFHAVESKRGMSRNGLQSGLSHISAAIQRLQLRRLARA